MSPYPVLNASVEAPAVPLPPNRRIAAGWKAFGLPPAGETGKAVLRFPAAKYAGLGRLRVAVALDVREPKVVSLSLARSGKALATIDMRWAHPFQPFEVPLPPAEGEAVTAEGVEMTQTQGAAPLFLFAETPADAPALRPHILCEEGYTPILGHFFHRLLSRDSVQAFGWMEGCVLDGLHDVLPLLGKERVQPALTAHLRSFFKDGNLSYEAPGGAPTENKIYGIEGTLPFAALALTEPQNPAIDFAVAFWRERAKAHPKGGIFDGGVTTEGGYTVGYPLAVVGEVRGGKELKALAVKQFLLRRDALTTAEAIHQRGKEGERPSVYRNWGRGAAWHILGMARALPFLQDTPGADEVRAELARACALALRWQRGDGLFSCYTDDPATGVDTSASAGIGAGLAKAAALGAAPKEAEEAAARTWRGLRKYLTPDGFLTGASQTNKGGEELQRSGWRGISQYAMGLLAQLFASLPESERRA